MNIGITGASGFLGSYLTESLSKTKEHNIYGLSRNKDRVNSKNIKWIIGDLSSKKVCKNLINVSDIIIHLAHINSPINSNLNYYEDCKINLIPSLNLLEEIRKSKKEVHLIFAGSSGAIYENSDQNNTHSEKTTTKPTTSYGINKLSFENYLSLGCEEGFISSTILRISNPYGVLLPRNRRQGLIGVALNNIICGRKVSIFGNHENIRDYIHLNDVVSSFNKSLIPQNHFNIFNIASGESFSVKQIIELLRKITKVDFEIEYIDIDDSNNLVESVTLDISKAKKILSWLPQYNLEQGLVEMWNRYK